MSPSYLCMRQDASQPLWDCCQEYNQCGWKAAKYVNAQKQKASHATRFWLMARILRTKDAMLRMSHMRTQRNQKNSTWPKNPTQGQMLAPSDIQRFLK